MKPAMSTISATQSDHRTVPAGPTRKRGRALVWVGVGVAAAFLLAVVALGAIGLWLASKASHDAKTSEPPIVGTPVQPVTPSPGPNDATADKPVDKPAASVVWKGKYVKADGKDGVTLELTDVTRTDDGLLKVSLRFRNTTDKAITIWSDLSKPYYVDPGARVSYPIMCNTKGKIMPFNRDRPWENGEPLASHSTAWIKAPANDVTRTYWAKLQGPNDAARKVTFYFPDFEPIEGVVLPPATK